MRNIFSSSSSSGHTNGAATATPASSSSSPASPNTSLRNLLKSSSQRGGGMFHNNNNSASKISTSSEDSHSHPPATATTTGTGTGCASTTSKKPATALAGLVLQSDWTKAKNRLRTRKGTKEASIPIVGEGGKDLPLHAALTLLPRRTTTTEDALLVVKGLIKAYPEGCGSPDKSGLLPLHVACREGCPLGVVQVLTEEHPEALMTPVVQQAAGRKTTTTTQTTTTTGRGTLPLHCALSRDDKQPLLCCPEVIMGLLGAYPRAVHVPRDEDGKLPLHLSVVNPYVSTNVVEQIFTRFVGAMDVKDDDGRTVLDCIRETYMVLGKKEHLARREELIRLLAGEEELERDRVSRLVRSSEEEGEEEEDPKKEDLLRMHQEVSAKMIDAINKEEHAPRDDDKKKASSSSNNSRSSHRRRSHRKKKQDDTTEEEKLIFEYCCHNGDDNLSKGASSRSTAMTAPDDSSWVSHDSLDRHHHGGHGVVVGHRTSALLVGKGSKAKSKRQLMSKAIDRLFDDDEDEVGQL